MNKNKEFDKRIEHREMRSKNCEMRAQATRNVCSKGVILGIAIACGSFFIGTISAWASDARYRKQIKNRVNNG